MHRHQHTYVSLTLVFAFFARYQSEHLRLQLWMLGLTC